MPCTLLQADAAHKEEMNGSRVDKWSYGSARGQQGLLQTWSHMDQAMLAQAHAAMLTIESEGVCLQPSLSSLQKASTELCRPLEEFWLLHAASPSHHGMSCCMKKAPELALHELLTHGDAS